MANRNVGALGSSLKIGNETAGNYSEFTTNGQIKRVGIAINSRASMATSLPGEYPTTLTTADTYYKISGTFIGLLLSRFTVSTAGVLKYIGTGEVVNLTGVSDFHCSKACELKYVIYLNGVLIDGTCTCHTITAASKNSNISITGLIDLNTNDELEIYAISDTSNTILTIKTLRVTAWGA